MYKSLRIPFRTYDSKIGDRATGGALGQRLARWWMQAYGVWTIDGLLCGVRPMECTPTRSKTTVTLSQSPSTTMVVPTP